MKDLKIFKHKKVLLGLLALVILLVAVFTIPPKGGSKACQEVNSFVTNETFYSEKTIINRLVKEGFSERSAKYAIKKADIDWYLQASNLIKRSVNDSNPEGCSYNELVDKMKLIGFTDKVIAKSIESQNIDWSAQLEKSYNFYDKHYAGKDKMSLDRWLTNKGYSDDEIKEFKESLKKKN